MKNSNQSAFPFPHQNSDGTIQYDANTGLTKREYFAAMAMQALIAYARNDSDIPKKSVEFADELLKQLEA